MTTSSLVSGFLQEPRSPAKPTKDAVVEDRPEEPNQEESTSDEATSKEAQQARRDFPSTQLGVNDEEYRIWKNIPITSLWEMRIHEVAGETVTFVYRSDDGHAGNHRAKIADFIQADQILIREWKARKNRNNTPPESSDASVGHSEEPWEATTDGSRDDYREWTIIRKQWKMKIESVDEEQGKIRLSFKSQNNNIERSFVYDIKELDEDNKAQVREHLKALASRSDKLPGENGTADGILDGPLGTAKEPITAQAKPDEERGDVASTPDESKPDGESGDVASTPDESKPDEESGDVAGTSDESKPSEESGDVASTSDESKPSEESGDVASTPDESKPDEESGDVASTPGESKPDEESGDVASTPGESKPDEESGDVAGTPGESKPDEESGDVASTHEESERLKEYQKWTTELENVLQRKPGEIEAADKELLEAVRQVEKVVVNPCFSTLKYPRDVNPPQDWLSKLEQGCSAMRIALDSRSRGYMIERQRLKTLHQLIRLRKLADSKPSAEVLDDMIQRTHGLVTRNAAVDDGTILSPLLRELAGRSSESFPRKADELLAYASTLENRQKYEKWMGGRERAGVTVYLVNPSENGRAVRYAPEKIPALGTTGDTCELNPGAEPKKLTRNTRVAFWNGRKWVMLHFVENGKFQFEFHDGQEGDEDTWTTTFLPADADKSPRDQTGASVPRKMTFQERGRLGNVALRGAPLLLVSTRKMELRARAAGTTKLVTL